MNEDGKERSAGRIGRSEFLATTMLAGIAAIHASSVQAQTAATTASGVVALPTIEVQGTGAGDGDPFKPSYAVSNATTGTKTNIPLIVTPAAINVVPRAVIQDQQVIRLQEALENVSGVFPNSSLGSGNRFIIRGFADGKIYRNGLLTAAFGRSEFDTANIERIEVLKGPAALLYGRSEPGGLINIVTKRPIDVSYNSVEQRFGSFNQVRTQWDSNNFLGDGNILTYRFSGGYQSNGSFRDFQRSNIILLNPSLRFQPTPDTSLVVDLEYFNQNFIADWGVPAVGNRPAPIPTYRSFGDPNDPTDNTRQINVGSEFTQRFNEYLTLRNRFLATFAHGFSDFVNPAPAFDATAALTPDGIMHRNIFGQINDTTVYATNLDLLGNFELWGTRHETLVGFDYLQANSQYSTFGNFNTPDPRYNINIYDPWPSYGIPVSDFYRAPFVRPQFGRDRSAFLEKQVGVYFQDHITIWDRLHIVGGGRYDWSVVGRGRGTTLSLAELNIGAPGVRRYDDAFSPRVGVLYQPLPWLSVYGSWTTGFGANNGVSAANMPQPAQTSEQWEAGVKAELFDQRLLATLAFYHLTKNNLLSPNLSTPDPNDTIAIGVQRSKGVEFDAVGKITDNISLISSFTYLDARVVEDSTLDAAGVPLFLGHRLPNVPRYAGSFWAKWDVNEIAELQGLSLGMGVYVVGNRQGDRISSFQLPGYARLDAMAAYKWSFGPATLIAQVNVRNFTNTTYYEGADQDSNVAPRLGIPPGAPRAVVGSIRVEF
jgi:iron complex outermembrane receptor protein